MRELRTNERLPISGGFGPEVFNDLVSIGVAFFGVGFVAAFGLGMATLYGYQYLTSNSKV
ncbi:MAG: hypothetical protein JSS07_12355 [Proteobacteria bacterium]|nr:hypothetical protein [Pseudomonadota bacterium]